MMSKTWVNRTDPLFLSRASSIETGNNIQPLYFCFWCLAHDPSVPDNFDVIPPGFRDNVCKECRRKEREEGYSMAKAMAE